MLELYKQIDILERNFWFKEYELESFELAIENFDKESAALDQEIDDYYWSESKKVANELMTQMT